LAEVRTVAVLDRLKGQGVGHKILETIIERARLIGVQRIFCLTFETQFFGRHGFEEIHGTPVDPDVYSELLRSYDTGVAEFLDLESVKPNTLGNTRMLKVL
jgi:amino-acid N-acetyltransferase